MSVPPPHPPDGKLRPPGENGYFDEGVAATYDDDVANLFDPTVVGPTVEFLAELAGDGRALELGSGTGRIALPLTGRGIEVGVPGLQRLPPGETFRVFAWNDLHWGVDEYDVETQGLISHHFRRVSDRIELQSIPFRYVWLSELDLMAEFVGMRLRERWADWRREPFTSESREHVSVWEKTSV